MKFTQFLLAAAVCATTAVSAQTTPSQTPRGTGSAAPNAVPSGTPAPAANPKGAVPAGEVFTTGSPDGDKMKMSKRDKGMKKKGSMSGSKMKTNM